MRRLLSFVMLLTSLGVMAQPKERRVYYLDCSYSMHLPNKIWDPVRNDLIKAIRNVNDETTELVVVPFSDKQHDHKPRVALATQSGKDQLIDFIRSYQVHTGCFTHHFLPLQDFESNEISDNRRTYMFLLTDGQDEDAEKRFDKEIAHWEERYGDREVYGFYVILHDSAKDTKREKIIDQQQHLWWVESADVNINLITIENKAVFNAKTEDCIELKVSGNLKGISLSATLEGSNLYRIKKTELVGNRLRLYLSPHSDKGSLPKENSTIRIQMTGGGPLSILVTDAVALTCEHKDERSLKIHIQ